MPAASWVGRNFGRFEVRRTLGEGGMGAVYLALDPQRGEEVALKVYFSPADRSASGLGGECELDAPEFRRSFLAKDGIPSRIRVPGVVPILEAGIEDERLWYTMPFLPQGNLWDRTSQGPLPASEAAEIVAQAARALQRVHEHGVVHRDIKPGNLMMDGKGGVVISDFGMAKLITSKRTIASDGMGTPAYMPPEQASGSQDVDARSDIYSLGAVLYEALTGVSPHPGNTTEEIIESIFVCDPLPPSSVKEGIPTDVEKICLRALQKEKQDRFQSARAFAEALEAWRRGETLRLDRPRRRWASWVAIGVILALALAAFLAWPAQDPHATRLVALAEAELHDQNNPARAEQLLSDALAEDPRSKEAHRLRAEARRALGNEAGAAEDDAASK